MKVLIKILNLSEGPVLELGIGPFSTPLLHMLCEGERKLFSYENDLYYFERHLGFVSEFHKIFFVENNKWDEIDIDNTKWGMVFIDHGPGVRRSIDAIRLSNKAQFVIIHDSDSENNKHYGYDKVYPFFKYRFDYKKLKPNTTILSNFVDISKLII
jgi:hypothetical protein